MVGPRGVSVSSCLCIFFRTAVLSLITYRTPIPSREKGGETDDNNQKKALGKGQAPPWSLRRGLWPVSGPVPFPICLPTRIAHQKLKVTGGRMCTAQPSGDGYGKPIQYGPSCGQYWTGPPFLPLVAPGT